MNIPSWNGLTLTQIFILLNTTVSLLFDAFIYFTYGNDYSISITIYRWSLEHPAVPLFIGLALGHILMSIRGL